MNFDGRLFHPREALFLPKPVKKAIPVWIGGNGPTGLRRAIRLGDGWHPVGLKLEAVRKGVQRIRDAKKELTVSIRMTTDVRKKCGEQTGVGGKRRTVVSGSGAEIRAAMDEYARAGLDYYCASILHPSAEEIVADLRKFASEVVRSY